MKQTIFSILKAISQKFHRLLVYPKSKPAIIVSLTSYPPRINNLQPTLKTIFNQTVQPDKIILWLAASEFPQKEADLPKYLIELIRQKKITIEWCNNLKPHKKYFYALQKYCNDIVITIDDDLLFSPKTIKCLLKSYKKFPQAVSAMRCHIMHPEGEKFADYNCFTHEQNEIVGVPSMRLLATNGAGSLFPPRLLDFQYFDENLINELCLNTDDLWLKAIEVLSDVPVVQPQRFGELKYAENSQTTSLWQTNLSQNANNINLEKIRKWAEHKFGKNILWNKIFHEKSNTEISLYHKLFPRKTLLYFVPHQDDELLTMGIDICSATTKNADVHVILCTDGCKSQTRKVLQNGQACLLHNEPHIYELSEEDFTKARDAEFICSCLLLGVPRENIHIPPERAVDGTLDVATAETIVQKYLQHYGENSAVCTIHFNTGPQQHNDHKVLGQAVYNLWQKGLICEVKFFKEPYCSSDNNISFTRRRASKKIAQRVLNAINNYGYWAPNEGRYAIGHHSVPQLFNNLRRKMKIYYLKMHK